jgi:hypothetical protein
MKKYKHLKEMNTAEIQALMIDNKLLNMAQIGRFLDISRERVRQIFNEKGVDFSDFKKSITITIKQKNISLPNENWVLIDFYDTAHNYYISNFGRVSRAINKTTNGTTFTQKKLLNPSSGKCNRLRVNLSLKSKNENDKNSSITVYVHSLVAKALKGAPIDGSFRVRHNDEDYSNNYEDNVLWYST